jgi:hypothetical protein
MNLSGRITDPDTRADARPRPARPVRRHPEPGNLNGRAGDLDTPVGTRS